MKRPLLTITLTALVLGAVLFLVMTAATMLSGRGAPKPLAPLSGSKVALVKIEGVLISSEQLVEEIGDHAENSSVKAIVLRIDSPGGGVVPSQEIYTAVAKARDKGKKVVVSMGSVAASGGYYIAAAADKIVANPGTITGSIGVKMEFANLERLFEKIGVQGMVVKSGEYKDIGSPYRAMTDKEKRLLQDVIEDVHRQFIEAVAAGRSIDAEKVRQIADGRIFTGRQALDLKLVDQLGDLDAGIRAAAALAGITGEPNVIHKQKKLPFFEYLQEETAAWIGEALTRGVNKTFMRMEYRYQ